MGLAELLDARKAQQSSYARPCRVHRISDRLDDEDRAVFLGALLDPECSPAALSDAVNDLLGDEDLHLGTKMIWTHRNRRCGWCRRYGTP